MICVKLIHCNQEVLLNSLSGIKIRYYNFPDNKAQHMLALKPQHQISRLAGKLR